MSGHEQHENAHAQGAHHGGAEAFSKSVMELGETESEAKRKVEEARKKASETVARARAKATEIVENASIEGEEKREQIVLAEKKKIDGENEAVISGAKARASETRKKAFKQLSSNLAKELLKEA